MPDFKVYNIKQGADADMMNGLYLILLHVDQSPPHIELLINGNIFSLSVKGNKIGEPFSTLDKVINQKSIPSLFFKIEEPKFFTNLELLSVARKVFRPFDKVQSAGPTCLEPIRAFFEETYNVDKEAVHYIFDLLPRLYRLGIVEGCYHKYLDDYLEEERFIIKHYSVEDIYSRINEIDNPVVTDAGR